MSFIRGLECKECGTEYPVEPRMMCDACFGPVEVAYDYDAMKGVVTRESIEAGPRSLWRYRDLLPIDGEPVAGLRSGFTPLVRADRLAKELGVRELYIKDDSANYPTFSYKDRVVSVALTRAVEFGYETVACASTGNLAHSVAAHAAAAGLEAVVLIPHDLEEGKVVGTLVFGPRMIKVQGNYDAVNRLCTQVADRFGWAIVNVNLRPYYTEGAKTHGFEIAEQLGWRLPQHTVVPVAGGTILPKIGKAYRELIQLGLVEDTGPKIHAGQAAGCDPVVQAIRSGAEQFQPQKPDTIARSIAIGNPADGPYAIRVVRDSGGSGGLGHGSRDPGRHRAPRPDRGDLHRAGGRDDPRRHDQAHRGRDHSPGRVDLRVHHRQRPEDHRGAGGPAAVGAGDRGPAGGTGRRRRRDGGERPTPKPPGPPPPPGRREIEMAETVSVHIPTALRAARQRPGAGRAGERDHPRDPRPPRRAAPGPEGAPPRRRGRAEQVRQRLRQRRGRALPREPGHRGEGRRHDHPRPLDRRGLTSRG